MFSVKERMDPKLQQAIVAVKGGRNDVAQQLLGQLLSENPQDENAWYLLSFLVESPERQERYLRKTLDVNPQHEGAKRSLAQRQEPIPETEAASSRLEEPAVLVAEGAAQGTAEIEVHEEPLAEQPPALDQPAAALPDWLQDLDNKRLASQEPKRTIDEEWRRTAGAPRRENSTSPEVSSSAPRPSSAMPVQPSAQPESADAWLIRGLIALVIIAAVVLGYLMFLILF